MATDLTISLENRPGELARLGEALGNAGINIEGMCGVTEQGRGVMHVCVENATAARMALEGAGIKVEGESDVVIVDFAGDDRPGKLGEIARAIADAGVNITFGYLATNTRGVLGTDDNEKARRAIS